MINARSETAATKPAFRDPLTNRRCLIPADGFYEWQRRGKTKQPFCFEVNEGEFFAFAGLWGSLERPERAVGQVESLGASSRLGACGREPWDEWS
jgi:putative SOS response-associated peptidase YedK